MDKISDWKARRSGGRITITGKEDDGHESRWPNIDTIQPITPIGGAPAVIVATDKNGESFELVA